jgi:hypothetical protein
MSLLGSLTFSVLYCRRIAYELFLRIHHGLAIVYLVSIWNHIWSTSLFPQIYIYVPLGVMMSFVSLLHLSIFVCRNSIFSSRPCPRAMVSCEGSGRQDSNVWGNADQKIITVRIGLAQAMDVKKRVST